MQCFSPIRIKNPDPEGEKYLTVPCGKCEACAQNKAAQWFTRLKMQQRYSKNAVFVTLTYNDQHLPPPRQDNDGFWHYDVSKDDIRHYHYRLRKALGTRSRDLKYFLISEYGPNPENGWLFRPHYHAIYYNLLENDYGKLERAWKNKGFVEFGEITDGRMAYVSGYVMEKLFTPPGALPPFTFISNGIGLGYVEDFAEYHRGQLDRFSIPIDGRSHPMPRYYKERLYSDDERAYFSDVCKQRAEETREAHLRFFGSEEKMSKYYSEMRADFVRKFRKKHKKKQNPNGTD